MCCILSWNISDLTCALSEIFLFWDKYVEQTGETTAREDLVILSLWTFVQMSCSYVLPLWLTEMVSQRTCTILGILRLPLWQGPNSLVEDKHKWKWDVVVYCGLGLARSGWVGSYALSELQRPPSCRTFDTVGLAHGRTKAANPACTDIPRCWNPLVSARWDTLVCSFWPVHTMLTTVFFHQQSVFAVYFLHFAASFLLCLLFFHQGSYSAAPAEVTERHSSTRNVKSL